MLPPVIASAWHNASIKTVRRLCTITISPHPDPPPLAGEGVAGSGVLPPPQAGEGWGGG